MSFLLVDVEYFIGRCIHVFYQVTKTKSERGPILWAFQTNNPMQFNDRRHYFEGGHSRLYNRGIMHAFYAIIVYCSVDVSVLIPKNSS